MDFSRPITGIDSIVTKSNIRFCHKRSQPPPQEDIAIVNQDPNGNDNYVDGILETNEEITSDSNAGVVDDAFLDQAMIDSSNQAAAEFFFAGRKKQIPTIKNNVNESLIDSSRYRQYFLQHQQDPPLPPSSNDKINPRDVNSATNLNQNSIVSFNNNKNYANMTIQEGTLIVIQESFGKLNFVYVKRDEIYSNRNGHFHHNDFINLPFGSKVRSRNNHGYGFCYLLKPTTELWTRSLNHRTQIVHELDQSQIVFQLYLRPGMKVVESGTGSGAVSYAIVRTIAPTGHLYTFEFNQHRAETAQQEFIKHGIAPKMVSVFHRDVCATGSTSNNIAADLQDNNASATIQSCSSTGKDNSVGGFNLPKHSIDGVFLDLPEPWHVISNAVYIMKPNCRIGSYSPCIEQTQRTFLELEQHGFHSIQTFEYRLMEHYVDTVVYESPPCSKRTKPNVHDIHSYNKNSTNKIDATPDTLKAADTNMDDQDQVVEACTSSNDLQTKNWNRLKRKSIKPFKNDNNDDDNKNKTLVGEHMESCSSTVHKGLLQQQQQTSGKEVLVARPFSMMRGHTAFLTFATSPCCSTTQENTK